MQVESCGKWYILNLWIDILSLRYADHVLVGDEVLVNDKDELTPTKVINVSDLTMQGDIYSGLFWKTM